MQNFISIVSVSLLIFCLFRLPIIVIVRFLVAAVVVVVVVGLLIAVGHLQKVVFILSLVFSLFLSRAPRLKALS